MEDEPDVIAKISGRYLINGNRILEVSQNNTKLMSKELGEDAKELVKVSDSTYVKRDNELLFQFKPNTETKTMNMLVLNANDGNVISEITQMDATKKMPIELLIEGDFDESLAAYRALKEQSATDPTVYENVLNELGYRYLNNDHIKVAHDILKVNMMLYPDSFNVYDSYAEVCMKLGEMELAIENYNKSIVLNPKNNNAKEMLKKIEQAK
jgi:tetratricopeptide (TPR) repeat protein